MDSMAADNFVGSIELDDRDDFSNLTTRPRLSSMSRPVSLARKSEGKKKHHIKIRPEQNNVDIIYIQISKM